MPKRHTLICPQEPFPHEGTFVPLASGQLHEIHAQAEGFATALAFVFAVAGKGKEPILLVRAPRRSPLSIRLYGEGMAGLDFDPSRLLIVEARDECALLQAGLDAARCPGLAAVVLETWGGMPRYDLTASRRLVLAAEKSGVLVIVLRGNATPRPSAAHSRWTIRSAPSVPLEADAPGMLACHVELSRRRGAPAGMQWRLEGKETKGYFHAERIDIAPLSGVVVSVAGLRTDASGNVMRTTRPAGTGEPQRQCVAADRSGYPGEPAGLGQGHDAGRCTGALPGPGELAA